MLGPRRSSLYDDAGGEELPSGADQRRIGADLEVAGEVLDRAAVAADIVEKVRIHAAAGKDADGALIGGGIVAGVFQRLPRAFQKDPVLRVGQLRLALACMPKNPASNLSTSASIGRALT